MKPSTTLLCTVALSLGACSKARTPEPEPPHASASTALSAPAADVGDAGAVASSDAAETPPATPPDTIGAAADASAPAAPPEAPVKDLGECELAVSGDAQYQTRSPGGGTSVGSEYWFTETELASIASLRAKNEAEAAALAKAEVKSYLLQLYCGDTNARAMFKVADGTSKAQFPLGPGKYVVKASPKPGEVGVRLTLIKEEPAVDGEGTFELTAFDHDRVVGTFDVPAVLAGKRMRYQGKFDMLCPSRTCGRSKAGPAPAPTTP